MSKKQSLALRCSIEIGLDRVYEEHLPGCNRKATHYIETENGKTFMCSYHAKQKRWGRYNPKPISKP